MKGILHISYLCMAAAWLGGCASSSVDDTPAPVDVPIRIAVMADNSRADASDAVLPGQITTANISEFGLWAYFWGDASPFMDDVRVRRQGASWVYSPLYYWPDKPLYFYGLTPYGSCKCIGWGWPHDNVSFQFKADGTKDVCYAFTPGRTSADGQVPLNFRHVCSQVIFNIRSSNPGIRVKIKQAYLCNPVQSAMYWMPKKATAGAITAESSAVQFNPNPNDEGEISLNSGAEVTLTSDALDLSTSGKYYFAPQTLADQVFLAVEMRIEDPESALQLWPRDKYTQYARMTFQLNRYGGITSWQSGKRYIYDLDIRGAADIPEISFDATVQPY